MGRHLSILVFCVLSYGCMDRALHTSAPVSAPAPSASAPLAGIGASTETGATDLSPLFSPKNAGTQERPFFIVDTAGIWPAHNIDVCWDNPEPAYEADRSLVKKSVSAFIEANSEYRFSGWGTCDSLQKGRIQIAVRDAQAESVVGYQQMPGLFGAPQPRPTRMTLNFTFQQWNQPCAQPPTFRSRCISTIAVHEFLHALGAIHEQLSKNLAQEDPECWKIYKDKADVHGTSPRPLTSYDPDSIMNYCRPIYSEPTRLSVLDLQGLTALSTLTSKKASGTP
jgi:hypothetical protein